jgi:hypothetical protein
MDVAGLPCNARDVVPPVARIKRGRHALGAAPAPDFRWLLLRVDAEGKAPTEINNVEDLLLEPAMGVEMAVDVAAGAEVHLCAPVTAEPLTGG